MLAPENPFAGKKKPSLGGFCEDNMDEVACSIIHSNMLGLIYNIVLAASQKTLSQIRLEFSLVICRCIIMSQIFIIFLQKVSLFHSYSRTCPCPYIYVQPSHLIIPCLKEIYSFSNNTQMRFLWRTYT